LSICCSTPKLVGFLLQCVTLKADGGAEWELGHNRVVQVSTATATCKRLGAEGGYLYL
jgi:hypothetical protein